MKSAWIFTIPLLVVAWTGCSKNAEPPPASRDASNAARQPDNTAVNERDRSGATVTPTDQSENEADRGLTQRVRQAIVADDSLSTNAQNIKIVTAAGVVTLRGPVNTAKEKSSIEAKAQQIAGVARVDNQLEVVTR